ncbi:MAG: phosphoglucosamine mutase [Peptococcaceae bacterium]|jgi:phosphoglucosamine mutase|nr:phosphoglucosamine mutase [Peptococcaceae bacterium]MDH7524730.1 phosphoglucosamine mutase [Peptococcaceae bacterium]
MAKLFGTDGVRGLANGDLTPELAFNLGRAAGTLLKKDGCRSAVVVGRDPRLSGPMLEGALTAGLCSAGVDVLLAGVIPTPAVAYLARALNTSAGVVISASHNPAPDNGIKFFNDQGFKLDDALEEKIENLIADGLESLPRPTGAGLGRVVQLADALCRYSSFLKSTVPALDLTGLRIVLDCANGAASEVAPRLLRELGAQVISIHDRPDGLNINSSCGSTHPESLQEAVLKYNAHLGLAHDGDADRLVAVDENGRLVNGDQIMVICGLAMQEKARLGGKVVVTVMSNLGLKQAFARAGIEVYETKVGDRFVLEKMLATGAVLGGEQSGHLIFLEHSTTGDGLLSALQLLQAVKDSGKSLSSLAGQMENLPQVLVNVKVRDKNGWEHNRAVETAVQDGQKALAGKGRLLVRASGTEPLIRVMAEGPDRMELKRICERVAGVIGRELGS